MRAPMWSIPECSEKKLVNLRIQERDRRIIKSIKYREIFGK